MKTLIIDISKLLSLAVLVVLCQFCSPKTAKTLSGSGYDEDLSVHRSEYDLMMEESKTNNSNPITFEPEKVNIEPTHHIGSELDSIKRIVMDKNKHIRYVNGYTIQLYSGYDKERANDTKRNAYELFEGIRPRMSYEQPNYKVKVGKYFNRLEANSHYTILKKKFSNAVLIPAKIRIGQN